MLAIFFNYAIKNNFKNIEYDFYTKDIRFYISSPDTNAKFFSEAVSKH